MRGAILSIPITILNIYKEVTLSGDTMSINGIHFINTILRHLKFVIVEHISNAEVKKLKESIIQVK